MDRRPKAELEVEVGAEGRVRRSEAQAGGRMLDFMGAGQTPEALVQGVEASAGGRGRGRGRGAGLGFRDGWLMTKAPPRLVEAECCTWQKTDDDELSCAAF